MISLQKFAQAVLPLAALLVGAAGDPGSTTNPATAAVGNDTVIAQRGDVKLTVGDVRALLDHADPQVRAQLNSPAALAGLVRDRLLQIGLVADARAQGWDQRPDMIQRMNEARDQVLAQGFLAGQTQVDPAYPSEADIAAAYDANKARFVIPKQYNLLQIAIGVPQGAPQQAEDEARRKAAELRTQALKPKADFADLARKSTPDGASTVGWVREDQLVPGVKEAVMGMADGAISEPVRTPTGYHVVKLLGTKPPAPASLADMHDQLVQALRQARQQQAARAYVDDMLKRQPIQLNEIDLTRVLAPR